MTVPRDFKGAEVHPAKRSTCFVCGDDNHRGMQIRFELLDTGVAVAFWTPETAWEGYPGIVHGGLVGTLLDEAMSKAVTAGGARVMTAEMRVRYRQPVMSGVRLTVRGWVVKDGKRLIEAEASIEAPGGVECAHGWGRFLPPRTLPD